MGCVSWGMHVKESLGVGQTTHAEIITATAIARKQVWGVGASYPEKVYIDEMNEVCNAIDLKV
jgi:hypothetical protein